MTLGAAPGSVSNGISGSDNGHAAATDDAGGGQIPLSGHSRFVQRLRRRYADELPLLAASTPTRETMASAYAALQKRYDVPSALRVLPSLRM